MFKKIFLCLFFLTCHTQIFSMKQLAYCYYALKDYFVTPEYASSSFLNLFRQNTDESNQKVVDYFQKHKTAQQDFFDYRGVTPFNWALHNDNWFLAQYFFPQEEYIKDLNESDLGSFIRLAILHDPSFNHSHLDLLFKNDKIKNLLLRQDIIEYAYEKKCIESGIEKTILFYRPLEFAQIKGNKCAEERIKKLLNQK